MKRAAIAHLVGSTFYIWATRWHLGSGCMCVHSGGSCLLAGAACTPTSAATSTPASPSICINLRLFHLRLCSSHPDFPRCTTVGGVCTPVCQVFPCLPACTCAPRTHRASHHIGWRISPPTGMCAKIPKPPASDVVKEFLKRIERKIKSKENITKWKRKYKKSKFGQNYSYIQMSTVQRQQIVWIENKIYLEKTGR